MMLVVSLSLFSALAAAYAIKLRKGEEQRQEWRRESRATWVKH